MNYLIYTIYGPVVSWGGPKSGTKQYPTEKVPTRSALTGLVAASMGIRRSEPQRLEKLHNCLLWSVRVDSEGKVFKDWQTVQSNGDPKARTRAEELHGDLETAISRRYYLQDALYTVAVRLREGSWSVSLGEIQEALKKPGFVQYYGRKTCTSAVPKKPKIIEADSGREALEKRSSITYLADFTKLSPKEIEQRLGAGKKALLCTEENIDGGWSVERLDRLVDPTGRGFIYRQENRTYV